MRGNAHLTVRVACVQSKLAVKTGHSELAFSGPGSIKGRLLRRGRPRAAGRARASVERSRMVALRNGMLVAAVGALQLVTAQPGVTMPTAAVLGWQLNDTGCFVHYNMATMAVHASPPRPNLQGCQDGVTAPPQISSWQPTALDTDAWVSTCKAMGGTRMIYVAKHGCGFAAWKSKVDYNYSVAQAPDQTDVVAAFVKSARAGGLGVGFYYSDATNSYCRVSGGVVKPGAVKPGRQIVVTQEEYDNIVLAHLGELWGNYVRSTRANVSSVSIVLAGTVMTVWVHACRAHWTSYGLTADTVSSLDACPARRRLS